MFSAVRIPLLNARRKPWELAFLASWPRLPEHPAGTATSRGPDDLVSHWSPALQSCHALLLGGDFREFEFPRKRHKVVAQNGSKMPSPFVSQARVAVATRDDETESPKYGIIEAKHSATECMTIAKPSFRRTPESGETEWMPAFAGMTNVPLDTLFVKLYQENLE